MCHCLWIGGATQSSEANIPLQHRGRRQRWRSFLKTILLNLGNSLLRRRMERKSAAHSISTRLRPMENQWKWAMPCFQAKGETATDNATYSLLFCDSRFVNHETRSQEHAKEKKRKVTIVRVFHGVMLIKPENETYFCSGAT